MEQWQPVEEIFHEALQRDPADRDAYSQQACRDDSSLRCAVAFPQITAWVNALNPGQRPQRRQWLSSRRHGPHRGSSGFPPI